MPDRQTRHRVAPGEPPELHVPFLLHTQRPRGRPVGDSLTGRPPTSKSVSYGFRMRLTATWCGPANGPRSTLTSPLAVAYGPLPPTMANVLVVPSTSVREPADMMLPA